MSDLLQKTGVSVTCRGELVILFFGSHGYSIEFPLALQIAAALHHEARMARLTAGMQIGGYRCLGTLTDANAAKPKRKRFMEKLPELLRCKHVGVKAEGSMVAFRVGTATRRMEYDSARTIAQWLRVKGREAKQNAGESRAWRDIANLKAIEAGERL